MNGHILYSVQTVEIFRELANLLGGSTGFVCRGYVFDPPAENILTVGSAQKTSNCPHKNSLCQGACLLALPLRGLHI